MSPSKSSPVAVQAQTPFAAKLDERSLQILFKEYDVLRELFSQAESSAQNIFNFYLTLVSTVIGAVVVILQMAGDKTGSMAQSGLVIGGLMIFVAVIGSVYLSSITGRYAHMTRYAQGIDAIRRFLLTSTGVAKPPIYEKFLHIPETIHSATSVRAAGLVIWLLPTGTYQFFVAAVNSLALGVAIWLLLSAASVAAQLPAQSFITCMVITLISYTVYNVYSHYVMRKLVQQLNIRLDTGSAAPFITGKQ